MRRTFATLGRQFALPGLLAIATQVGAAATLTAEAPPVGPFSEITMTGHAELILVQGDREAVVVEASPKARTKIRVRSQDGRLRIDANEQASGWGWLRSGGDRRPTVTVYFKSLEALDVRGAMKVTSNAIQAAKLRLSTSGATSMKIDALNVESLRFTGSGAVKVELAGTASEQSIAMSGAGAFRAPKFASNAATVKVSGAGRVVVNAQKTLDASISGAGVIEYYGDPALTQRVSGAGKITRRSSPPDAAPMRTRAALVNAGAARAAEAHPA